MNQQKYPKIYRKRFIPDELICLKDDYILRYEPNLLITGWLTLKPRRDIARGVSAYILNKGIKVSKIYDRFGRLVYWYCDIIRTVRKPEENSLIFEDLLLDVIVYEDGSYRVADLGEAADALEQGLITQDMLISALRTLDKLLETINNGEFTVLQKIVNDSER